MKGAPLGPPLGQSETPRLYFTKFRGSDTTWTFLEHQKLGETPYKNMSFWVPYWDTMFSGESHNIIQQSLYARWGQE